tara:strand:+ start:79 stop:282 length:204 start_codon:yes stop_codon:yes gene_type:complete
MRYNLNVSGEQYKLIRASLVSFQIALEKSDGDYEQIIDDLDRCFEKITEQHSEQLAIKVKHKWGVMK